MNIVVTIDENWAIGKGDSLLTQIPGDQRYFQNLTKGGIVVMGRKTMQAMPQGQPLYGRDTVILSANPNFKVKGATVFHDKDSLLTYLKGEKGRDIYICGGESLYEQFLPECDTAYVTLIEKSYDANRRIANLEQDPGWEMTEESDEQTCFDITYYFRKYERCK